MKIHGYVATWITFILLILVDLTSGVRSHEIEVEDMDLLLLQVVFRHGDRSPMASYPTDPHQEKDWPRGFAQLSQDGMKQHYHLGQYFKKRYIDGNPYKLLNESYVVNELHVRSTDIDRTLMSAYSNLAGLYPPDDKEKWNPDIPWQPIPVHTVPVSEDYLLSTDSPCPKFDQLFKDTMKSPAVVEEEKRNAEFYQHVSNKTGIEPEGIATIWRIKDTVFCEKQHDFIQPSWVDAKWNNTERSVFDKLEELDDLEYVLQYEGQKQSRLRGGPLLKEMINNMQGKMNQSIEQKFFMYSSHDSMVAGFSCALQTFNGIQPPYASSVIVEFFNSSTDYVIKVLYHNETGSEQLYTMDIPGCGDPCYFTKFVELTADRIPGDIEKECQLTSTSMVSKDQIIIIALGSILLVVFIIAVVLYSLYKCRGSSRYERYYGIQVAA